MCGICGIVHYAGGGHPDRDVILRMCRQIIHRGPDDEGSYVSGVVGMGMRRLSIIDVGGGHQPMCNEDESVRVVFNGEIYNYRELKAELEGHGHVFRTQSDTEVIVHGYEQWGVDCVLRFNGIFGLSVWDERRQELFLARDHFGVKPLYFYDDGRRICWASEIKAILVVPGVPREVEPAALDAFLVFGFVPSPGTMFAGIRKLAPGHRLICSIAGIRVERYWVASTSAERSGSEKEWIEELRVRFEQGVKRQLISDVPLGALLSGGVDSAMVVAVMAQASSRPVKTFTVGFKDGGDSDERDDARATARLFATDHHDILLDHADYTGLLERIAWHMDEPVSTSSALAMYCVCELARKHVTVVLTGQGVDEPMAGYHRYYGERYGHWFRRVPSWLRQGVFGPAVEGLPRNDRAKRTFRSLGLTDPAVRFTAQYAVFGPEMRAQLWRPEFGGTCQTGRGVETVRYWLDGVSGRDSLGQMTYVDARLSLADNLLLYGDKMSMAHSIEARVPFLDLNFMEAAENLPAHLKISGRQRKYIHRKVAAKWLPPTVIYRRKRGFQTPVDSWFRSELSGYVRDTLTATGSACSRYFNTNTIHEIMRDHTSGRHDHRRQLFALLSFELWHKVFIGSPSPTGTVLAPGVGPAKSNF